MTQNDADTKVTIRSTLPSDAESIAAIYNHYVRAGGATFDCEPWTHQQTEHLLQCDQDSLWLIATTGSRAAGWASARRFSARHGYRFSLETAVYIHHEFTTRGIGRRLMYQLEEQCRGRNVHHLMARIISGNQDSLRFHEGWGFEIIGIQKEVGRMNDAWLDVVLMQKLLD